MALFIQARFIEIEGFLQNEGSSGQHGYDQQIIIVEMKLAGATDNREGLDEV